MHEKYIGPQEKMLDRLKKIEYSVHIHSLLLMLLITKVFGLAMPAGLSLFVFFEGIIHIVSGLTI